LVSGPGLAYQGNHRLFAFFVIQAQGLAESLTPKVFADVFQEGSRIT